MKPALPALLLLAALSPAARAESCCETCTCAAPAKPAATTTVSADTAAAPAVETPAPVGHPLRGVVVDILADRQALLVKHEEIPGVMKAMTMLLKVDPAVLPTVQKGQAITATLIDKDDGWWLLDVKPVHSDG